MLDVQLLYTFILPVPTRVEALEPLYPVDGFGDQPSLRVRETAGSRQYGPPHQVLGCQWEQVLQQRHPDTGSQHRRVTVGRQTHLPRRQLPHARDVGYNRWVRVYTLTGERRDSEDMSHRTNTNNHGLAFLNGRIRMVHNANLTGYCHATIGFLSFSPSGELRREEILELGFADNGQASLKGLTITPTRMSRSDNTPVTSDSGTLPAPGTSRISALALRRDAGKHRLCRRLLVCSRRQTGGRRRQDQGLDRDGGSESDLDISTGLTGM